MDTFTALSAVLAERRHADPGSSYVASLYADGLNRILQKVGEEATEVILAARDMESAGSASDDAAEALAAEVADLWFHSMVMLTHQGVPPQRVLDILAARFGTSGLTEKASR